MAFTIWWLTPSDIAMGRTTPGTTPGGFVPWPIQTPTPVNPTSWTPWENAMKDIVQSHIQNDPIGSFGTIIKPAGEPIFNDKLHVALQKWVDNPITDYTNKFLDMITSNPILWPAINTQVFGIRNVVNLPKTLVDHAFQAWQSWENLYNILSEKTHPLYPRADIFANAVSLWFALIPNLEAQWLNVAMSTDSGKQIMDDYSKIKTRLLPWLTEQKNDSDNFRLVKRAVSTLIDWVVMAWVFKTAANEIWWKNPSARLWKEVAWDVNYKDVVNTSAQEWATDYVKKISDKVSKWKELTSNESTIIWHPEEFTRWFSETINRTINRTSDFSKLKVDPVVTSEKMKVYMDSTAWEFLSKDVPKEKLSETKIPAQTPDQIRTSISQLEKMRAWYSLPITAWWKIPKGAAWVFKVPSTPKRLKEFPVWQINVKKYLTDTQYLWTVAHEIAHGIENYMNGPKNMWKQTYQIFGKDLTKEQTSQIEKELIANTKSMVGEKAFASDPEYYGDPSELFARFMQNIIRNPYILDGKTPLAFEKIMQSAKDNPIISDYIDAHKWKIDKGQITIPQSLSAVLDQRGHLRNVFWQFLGDKIYNTEKRLEVQKSRIEAVFSAENKKVFKWLKDKAGVTDAIESIKITRDGQPEFWTRDKLSIKEEDVTQWLQDNAKRWWRVEAFPTVTVPEWEVRVSTVRYTPEQWQKIYDKLNDRDKEIVRQFTAARKDPENVSFINRENFKHTYGTNTDLEWWFPHIFESDPNWTYDGMSGGIKKSVASSMKFRKWETWYIKDPEQAILRSAVWLEKAVANNDFIMEFMPQVSKPLRTEEEAAPWWVAIDGWFEKKIFQWLQNKKLVMADGNVFQISHQNFQVPRRIYDQYIKKYEALSQMNDWYAAFMDMFAKYYQVNLLAHPGTVVNNFYSWWIQFWLKIISDTYLWVLTWHPLAALKNLKGVAETIFSKDSAPEWLYWGRDQWIMKSLWSWKNKYTWSWDNIHQKADYVAAGIMKPMQAVETFYKKIIANSEWWANFSDFNKLTTEWLKKFDFNDKAVIDEIHRQVDLYAYDYNNVPDSINGISDSWVWRLMFPFMKYRYKYLDMMFQHTFAWLDSSLPWREKVARTAALWTAIGIIYEAKQYMLQQTLSQYSGSEENAKEIYNTINSITEENAPKRMNTNGKIPLHKNAAWNIVYLDTKNLPILNFEPIVKWDIATWLAWLWDPSQIWWILLNVLMAIKWNNNEYDMYKTTPEVLSTQASSLLPLWRVAQWVGDILQTEKKSPQWAAESFLAPYSGILWSNVQWKTITEKIPTPDWWTETVPVVKPTLYEMLSFLWLNISELDPKKAKLYIDRAAENKIVGDKRAFREKFWVTNTSFDALPQEAIKSFYKIDGAGPKVKEQILNDMTKDTREAYQKVEQAKNDPLKVTTPEGKPMTTAQLYAHARTIVKINWYDVKPSVVIPKDIKEIINYKAIMKENPTWLHLLPSKMPDWWVTTYPIDIKLDIAKTKYEASHAAEAVKQDVEKTKLDIKKSTLK